MNIITAGTRKITIPAFGPVVPARPRGGAAAATLFQDTFTDGDATALPAHTPDVDTVGGGWVAKLGVMQINSNQARANTIAADGNNLITNGEFTVDTSGWIAQGGAILTRRDFTVSPDIDPTGGADEFGMEVQGVGSNGWAYQDVGVVIGVTYLASTRAYAPSGNTADRTAYINWGSFTRIIAEDVWETIQRTRLATIVTLRLELYVVSTTSGDKSYYDAASVQAQLAIATFDSLEADLDVTVKVTMPASGTVPFGIVARYTDAANYWLWRIRPGTAGNDFELIEVSGGVQTVRSAADVDWTGAQQYTLRLRHNSTDYRADVDDVETLSFVDAGNFNTTETIYGLYDAASGNAQFDDLEAIPCDPF